MPKVTKWERGIYWAIIFILVFYLIDNWGLECSIVCTMEEKSPLTNQGYVMSKTHINKNLSIHFFVLYRLHLVS